MIYNTGKAYNSGFRYKAAVHPVVQITPTKGRKYMTGNPIPENDESALAMGDGLADGLHSLESTLGIKMVTEAMIRGALAACETGDDEANDMKDIKQAASTALQQADDAATQFLLQSKNILASFLGNRWSASWEPTGFPDESTAIPTTQEKRMNLCKKLNSYFTRNPTREFATAGVTAAKALENFTALSDGRDHLAEKVTVLGQKMKARDVAYANLRKEIRGSIHELSLLLGPDDDRWHRFLLSAPNDPATPEPVESVALRAISATEIMATWPRAPRATRYRPFVQIVGVDEDAKARDSVNGLEVTLTGFHAGQTVKVYIVAANDDGEGNPGPTEQITL